MLDATTHATKMIYRPILISQAVPRTIHYHPRDAKQQLSRRNTEKVEASGGILVPWSEKAKKMGKNTHSQAEKWQCARSVVLWFFFSIFSFRTSSRRRKHVHNGITSCWQSFCRHLLFNIDSNTDTSNQSEQQKRRRFDDRINCLFMNLIALICKQICVDSRRSGRLACIRERSESGVIDVA